MALFSSSSGIFSMKNIALISTSVLSAALLLKLSVSDFAISEIPAVYFAVISWLRPPYLYLVINCIIISIVASSKLQQHKAEDVTVLSSGSSPVFVQSHDYVNGVVGEGSSEYHQEGLRVEEKVMVEKDGVVLGAAEEEEAVVVKDGGDCESVVSEKSKEGMVRSDSIDMLLEKVGGKKEKPPASARIGHKKSVKASPEVGKGAALGVTRSKRNDTLESTWKMITDGRPMPLARHLKKSDTWDTHVRSTPSPSPLTITMKKSETINETKSKLRQQNRQGSGRLKREPSPSQDELNRRVEAFIKKFNEEMRLQRQESLNQYQEMIARGAY